MSQLLLDIAPEHSPTLDNFVTGRNAELLRLLQDMTTGGELHNVHLWGETGSGKTHLLRACVRAFAERGYTAVYAAAEVPETSTDVVAIDDVERLDEAAQIRMFDLFNRMREAQGIMLVAGSAAPLHLALRDDLRSRLGWGLIYQLHALNDDEKCAALREQARQRGFTLPEEVVRYLLTHVRRDLPGLVTILDALDEHSLRLQRQPSIPMLKEILQDLHRSL
ncbi:MAG: DnaA regulatory inactivator Hda [Gallionella sp.]|jgi:DnaA family protein|nr:DnaA regulatory inactivator Hda [Gallionella sp.]